MKHLDELSQSYCKQLLKDSPYGKLETLQSAATHLMERAGQEIAKRHNGTEAMDAFILASEFDQYVGSVRNRLQGQKRSTHLPTQHTSAEKSPRSTQCSLVSTLFGWVSSTKA